MMHAHSSPCDIKEYRHGDDVLVLLTGVLRLDNCEEVKNHIRSVLEREPARLYFVLAQLREIDSAGLGVLVGLHITARKKKCEFVLVGPTAVHANLLKLTRLDQILHVVSGLEAGEIRRRFELPGQLVANDSAHQSQDS